MSAVKPFLFICHTQYQVMVSVVKLLCEGCSADFWLSSAVPGREALAVRLRGLPFVRRVFCPQDTTAFYPSLPPKGRFQRRVKALRLAVRCRFPLLLGRYTELCLYNDWNVAGCYLQDRRAPYVLGEDTYNHLTGPNHWIDEQAAQPGFSQRRQRGEGYSFWGAYRGVTAVEVAKVSESAYYHEKLRGFDPFEKLAAFGPPERAVLRQVFIQQELPAINGKTCLFLPRSYYVDRDVFTQEAQDRLCKDIVARYANGYQLFIKTHPRDTTDYHTLFPGAVVLDRFMPVELLDYCFDVKFSRAVGFHTNAIRNIRCAQEIIEVTDLSLDDYRT